MKLTDFKKKAQAGVPGRRMSYDERLAEMKAEKRLRTDAEKAVRAAEIKRQSESELEKIRRKLKAFGERSR